MSLTLMFFFQAPSSFDILTASFQVPATMRFVLEGEMPAYILAKDLILQVSLQTLNSDTQILSAFNVTVDGPRTFLSEYFPDVCQSSS